MERFVLDASIALTWLMPDEESSETAAQVAARARQKMLRGAQAVVPALWHLEVANVLSGLERRGKLRRDVRDILNDLELLAARLETASGVTPIGTLMRLAGAYGLTAYDAEYFHLAERLALPLATSDGALEAAARKAGIPLIR